LAREFPTLPIVLNHLGLIRPGLPDNFGLWAAGLRRLAEHPAVFCRVSALTEDTSGYSKLLYAHRHVVENFFGRIKRLRRVGTRYEKLSETFLGFVTLAAIIDWVHLEV
jgi:transposase